MLVARLIAGLLWLVPLAACGGRGGGSPRGPAPDPNVLVPRLADPTAVYRQLGFLAKGQPLPFVASMHFLAGPVPDSTLSLFGLSMTGSALNYRRVGNVFEARYRVEAVFRRGTEIVGQIGSDQHVRVAAMAETRRADESVIFQHFILLPPGEVTATVVVRDRNGLTSTRDDGLLRVPRFDGSGPRISSLVPIHQGTPRATRSALPTVLANPRATSPQGADTLSFYLEAYDVSPGTRVFLRARHSDSAVVWSDTVTIGEPEVAVAVGPDTVRPDLAAVIVRVAPPQLQLGELRFDATLGGPDTSRTMALVTFSEQWAVTNLDDVLSLLRYFGHEEEIGRIRAADAQQRSELWRTFWRRTDPDTLTPENEGIAAYFRRLLVANLRFRDESEAGWLTDRGEVYITVGEPDREERYDDLRTGRTVIRWTYFYGGETVLIYFINEISLNSFRLTFSSRVEYQRLLTRVRRSTGQAGASGA
ncbi:MAG TPA: GWxTD domain-containing protein [Gemmatimonadales bacterium]|nr:GWxTD domain-containing protein [Gemmatimonadales bacterium]